jgi:flagellar hook assembly protein FlgD
MEFTLPVAMKAKIEVYNILGALVATPFDGVATAGTNSVVWDGKDARGQNVASGVYLYRLVADKYTETRKMMLLK